MRLRKKPRSVYWRRCCRQYVWSSRRELWQWFKEAVLYATGRHPLIAWRAANPGKGLDLTPQQEVRIQLDCIVWLAKIDWQIITRRYKNGCPWWRRPEDERDYAITFDELSLAIKRLWKLSAAWDPRNNGEMDKLLDVPELDPNAPGLTKKQRKAIVAKRGVIVDRFAFEADRMVGWRGLLQHLEYGIERITSGEQTLDGREVALLSRTPHYDELIRQVDKRDELQRARGVLEMERVRLWAEARDAAGVDSAAGG